MRTNTIRWSTKCTTKLAQNTSNC